jgi:hypothetical protein
MLKRIYGIIKMCTHVSKCKMIPVKTTPGIGREGKEREWLKRWIHI